MRGREGVPARSYTSAVPGPLVARWRSWSLEPPRAGALTTARAEVENAGTATWGADIAASYHWLDERGNAIVWDGIRSALPGPVAPGESVALEIAVRAPMPPARYGFALDLVAEHRAWFGELGENDAAERGRRGAPARRCDSSPRCRHRPRFFDHARVGEPRAGTPRRGVRGRRRCDRRPATPPQAARAAGRLAPAASPASRTRSSARPCCTASSSSGSRTSKASPPSARPPTSRGSTTPRSCSRSRARRRCGRRRGGRRARRSRATRRPPPRGRSRHRLPAPRRRRAGRAARRAAA